MISVMLIVKHTPDQKNWEGAGRQEYALLPRVGEHVELERDGKAYLYRVVAVCHPTGGAPNVGDVYAVCEGVTADVVRGFLNQS